MRSHHYENGLENSPENQTNFGVSEDNNPKKFVQKFCGKGKNIIGNLKKTQVIEQIFTVFIHV